MPTHQSIGGASDEELLQRMVQTHPDRFDEAFWRFYATSVASSLPTTPVIVDLGCGPGLFLHDLGQRHPTASLHGYDVTAAMVDYARKLAWGSAAPTFRLLDVSAEPLPHAPGTVDLLGMSSVLHVLDEPLVVLAEIRRVLAPQGLFLLHDWIRQPLAAYLAWRRQEMKESEVETERRGFRLFPVHNKYTAEDWRWLLATARFTIRHEAKLRQTHHLFVATASPA